MESLHELVLLSSRTAKSPRHLSHSFDGGTPGPTRPVCLFLVPGRNGKIPVFFYLLYFCNQYQYKYICIKGRPINSINGSLRSLATNFFSSYQESIEKNPLHSTLLQNCQKSYFLIHRDVILNLVMSYIIAMDVHLLCYDN